MESRVFCGIGRVNHANKLAKDKDAHKEPTTTPVVRTNDSFCLAFLANLNPTQIAGDLLDCVTDFERVMGICVRMLENFMNDLEKEHLYRKFKSTKESELTTTQETLAELEQKSAIGRCCGDSAQFKTSVGV